MASGVADMPPSVSPGPADGPQPTDETNSTELDMSHKSCSSDDWQCTGESFGSVCPSMFDDECASAMFKATAGQSEEPTRFDVITGKGRSNEGVGNENYKALVEDNKVCRLVASSSLRDISNTLEHYVSENDDDARLSTQRPPKVTR